MATRLKPTSTVRWTDTYTRSMADHLAEISGQSVNGVVMSAIRFYGEHLLAERKSSLMEFGPIVLSPKDYEALMESLKNPPKPNAALKRGMSKNKRLKIERKGY
jgi:uncharacterized protein (DUF1778 family)